jgi:hypothetical protein
VSNKWIKYKPLSSDFSSLTQGYGDPMLGETGIVEKTWRGDDVTEDDPSS